MEKALTTYKAPVNSYPLSQQRAGMFASGRYTGFDILEVSDAAPGFTGVLKSGQKTTLPSIDEDNAAMFAQGTLMTKHGLVIKSSDDHSLSITPNASIPIRYDIIYCEYAWTAEEGGGPILWGILEGPADGVLPELTNPNTQVIVGVITVPINATSATITYEPAKVPLPGGADILDNFPVLKETFAQLNEPNRFTRTQSLKDLWQDLVMDSDNSVILGDNANTFFLNGNGQNFTIKNFVKSLNVPFPTGTKIGIYFYETGLNTVLSSVANAAGYRIGTSPVTSGLSSITVVNADYYEFVLSGSIWYCTIAAGYLARLTKIIIGSITATSPTIMRAGRTANRAIKVGDLVTIDAGFTAGVDASNNTPTLIGQLPTGTSPAQPVEFPIILVPTGATTTTRTGTCLIGTDGAIRAYHHGALSTSLACDFNLHVTFPTI